SAMAPSPSGKEQWRLSVLAKVDDEMPARGKERDGEAEESQIGFIMNEFPLSDRCQAFDVLAREPHLRHRAEIGNLFFRNGAGHVCSHGGARSSPNSSRPTSSRPWPGSASGSRR